MGINLTCFSSTELFRFLSGGQNIDRESPIPYKEVRKKTIAKPAKLILFLFIIRGIRIKEVEETNGEMSKGYEQFTRKICPLSIEKVQFCS